MIFPVWAIFSLGVAVFSATMLLLQERYKVDGFALSFWNKVACAVVMLPFVIYHGLPDDILFYAFLFLSALVWCVSDVIFFRVVPEVGAGVISRVMPSSVIFGFLVWFIVRPGDIALYAGHPWIAGMIAAVLALWAYCAMHLRHCPVSVQAVRKMWLVLAVNAVGPSISKLATEHADAAQGAYGYVFVEAVMMLGLWTAFFFVQKKIKPAVLIKNHAWRHGPLIGVVSSLMVLSSISAIYRVDNPAYPMTVHFLDTVLILCAYRLMKRKREENVWAGMGMVVCAAIIVLLRAQL